MFAAPVRSRKRVRQLGEERLRRFPFARKIRCCMPWADIPEFRLTLLCTALAAAVLAVLVLTIEFLGNRRMCQRAPGWLASLLAVIALVAFWWKGAAGFATGCGGLAMLLLVAWPVSF